MDFGAGGSMNVVALACRSAAGKQIGTRGECKGNSLETLAKSGVSGGSDDNVTDLHTSIMMATSCGFAKGKADRISAHSW